MASIIHILQTVSESINRIINNISPRLKKDIKRGFFALIFICSIVGAVIGIVLGNHAASIPGAPLVSSMNDLLEYARYREKPDGDFGNMLESSLIAEVKYRELDKTQFRTREPMNQAYNNIPIEPQTSQALSVADMNVPQDLIEGNYRDNPIAGDVNIIKRRSTESLIPAEIKTDGLAPLETDEKFKSDNTVKNLSATEGKLKPEIPNQIDLNSDKLTSPATSEKIIIDKTEKDLTIPNESRNKSQPKIPGQIDTGKEIIR